MAAKKKSNYISYELKKLDLYMGQLQDFLDKNPPNLAVDRIERIVTARGEAIKVIASIEDQVKMFLLALEKLPKVLEDLNRLRKEVENGKQEIEMRGDQSRPGFMDDDEDDEDLEENDPKPKKNVKKSKKEDSNTSAFDDDDFFEGDETAEETPPQLELPPSSIEGDDDEGDDNWLADRED
jgi:hypothetical protein